MHAHDLRPMLTACTWPVQAWTEALDCRECGLRMLLLLLHSRSWVTRRVERVAFHDDRTVVRRVSTDFCVPNQAPAFQVDDDTVLRLVPLTVMRRKTLVNFGLSDGQGNAVSLLGMRPNQKLTLQMILGLADMTPGVCSSSPQLRAFAEAVAAGTQEELSAAFTQADRGELGPDVSALIADAAAARLLVQFANNFLLLVTVDENGPPRRILRFAYDEPLSLEYKHSGYDQRARSYRQTQHAVPRWTPQRLAAALGLTATVVRFPVPAAENAQSYHFEIEAPPGLMIASASMIAGRPSEDLPPSWDHVAGGFPVVGLHVCDVPNGSMSRAQVLLRLRRRGWLSTSLLTSALSGVLLWVCALAHVQASQAAAVAAALLTITAAIVVFVVRSGKHEMANRLVSSVRAAATGSVALLITAASLITFAQQPPIGLLGTCAVSGTLCTVLVLLAWICARPSRTHISPWEQGLRIKEICADEPPKLATFETARTRFHFDRPSIKVESSEGDHREEFRWTQQIENEFTERLRQGLDRARGKPAPVWVSEQVSHPQHC